MDFLLIGLGVFFVLPIVSYLVVKFGTAGYFRAKNRDKQKDKDRNEL